MRAALILVSAVWLLGCGDDDPQPIPDTNSAGSDDRVEPSDVAEPDSGPSPDDVPDVESPADHGPVDTRAPDTKPPEPTVHELVDMFSFITSPPESDPWFGDGEYADEYQCEPFTHMAEVTEAGAWYDVETSFCGYLTVSQPLAVAVPKGAELAVSVRHDVINEADDGVFTLAVGMGDPAETVWTKTIEVPAESSVFTETWTAERDYEQGEPVYWHLENHGDNVWSLTGLTATF